MAFYILFSYIVSCKDNVRKMIDNGDFKYWKDDSDRATYYYFDGLFMNDMILFVNMMVLTIFCMNIGIW